MKANRQTRDTGSDEGVSPVIAVILMVAITVVLAATVYVWVSGFASDESGPESAQARASGFDESGNGATDWVRLTLVQGENAPYSPAVTDLTLIDHDGDVLNTDDDAILCDSLAVAGAVGDADETCSSDWTATDTNEWDAGQTLFVPCMGDGAHQFTLTIRGSTILDERINCDEIAT